MGTNQPSNIAIISHPKLWKYFQEEVFLLIHLLPPPMRETLPYEERGSLDGNGANRCQKNPQNPEWIECVDETECVEWFFEEILTDGVKLVCADTIG